MSAIVSAIMSIFSNVVTGITDEQKTKLTLELQTNENLTDLLKAQASIDANEAASSSMFVAGWRPAVGWVCALAFAWHYLLQPMITYFCIISGHSVPALPTFNYTEMSTVLMGMLGLGGMRSWEKYNGVQNNH